MIGLIVALGLAAVSFGVAVRERRRGAERGPRPLVDTGRQYKALIDRRSVLRLGVATAGAAVLAHTGADEAVSDWYESDVRGPRGDVLSEAAKSFGERPWFALWAGFALLDGLTAGHPLLRWGRRNFEAMVVGLPVLWTAQYVGGGGRPDDEHRDARWRPFSDDNTASGHTFIAAIPWLNARRDLDAAWLRRLAWLASWGTGWSRLNDRKHFLSQVGYGHAIASAAVEAVGSGERPRDLAPGTDLA